MTAMPMEARFDTDVREISLSRAGRAGRRWGMSVISYGKVKMVESAAELLRALGVDHSRPEGIRQVLAWFMEQPEAAAMPEQVRRELQQRGLLEPKGALSS